tara:strand:+ start:874 stop:1236 length:363 start_codon:yes stop_codon:yes gene_type:complete
MATVKTQLTLVSSTSTSATVNLEVSDTLDTTNPVAGVSRATVSHTTETVLIAASTDGTLYTYLRNMDPTNIVDVKTDGAVTFAKLGPHEAMWLPINGGAGLELQANTAACVVEYAYWKKS